MDLSRREDFDEKLTLVLRKIIECKKFDETFIDNFLTNISHEFYNRHDSISQTPYLSKWLLEAFQKWNKNGLILSEAVFICKFIGVWAQYEQGFQLLFNNNVINELINVLQLAVLEKTVLKPVYIDFLSFVCNHAPGYEWLKTTKQWKVISNLYFSNSNLYVERKGLHFLRKFISKAAFDDEASEEIFQELFFPIIKYNDTSIEDKNFCSVVLLFLKLMHSLMKMNVFTKNHSFYVKIKEIFDIERFLNFLMENCKQEIILDEASVLKVLFFVTCYEDKNELLSLEDVPAILDAFYTMLKQNQFNGLIKLAKNCLVLWSEMRNEIKCKSKIGVDFIVVQLLPALICIKPPDTALCDIYIQKLFSLTTTRAQKFCYLFRDEIRSKVSSKPKNLALKSILSVISNTECLNLEEAVIIFQAMAYILKSFIPDSICSTESVNNNKSEKDTSLCLQDTQLLLAVLSALRVYIEKFKINWPESLESLCLLKMTCVLLENAELSSVVVVQVFVLVKLLILNFMSPDLALLLNNTKDSSFDCLMPLLFTRLHDPNWEIRDSCLEIVAAIAELSESKYPAFQQLLIEKDFCSLIVDIMEGDSESYVRASAIQALSAMTKIENFNYSLIKMDFPHKIIKLLQNESEAIVRREAALIIKQIYLTLNDLNKKIVTSFYEIMTYLAVCDLHWEVKVNSLTFWEAVIQRTIADQGMIDGSFPKVTFSKEHKKIVNLTKDEIKLRLDKVLRKLSEIGCLYVLLSTLNEDCDMPVIRKSAQVLSDFITILKRYEVMDSCKDILICNRIPAKRKITVSEIGEKRKTPTSISRKSSNGNLSKTHLNRFNNEGSTSPDVIIDSIVNEMDINLLVSVCSQEEKTEILQKKVLFQEIKPETFLSQMQDFELEKFLEDKQKWLLNSEMDLTSLSETYMINMIDETNIMDCY